MAIGWVAMCLLLLVNKPEDVGIEGADTVANAGKEKEKGIPAPNAAHGLGQKRARFGWELLALLIGMIQFGLSCPALSGANFAFSR